MEADTCPRLIEPTLSFTQGLIVGQLSVVLVLAAFIKFFIFGDPPSADVTASLRATERRSRTLAHKRSLLSIRSPANRGDRSQDRSLSRKKSTVLRNPPTLTIGSILSKAYYNVDSHQPESLDWFNVLIAQTIAQFRSDAQHDDAILDSLTKALNGDSRPDFIDEIRVTELSLGEDFPILSNCRIIPVDEDGVSLAPGKKFDPATAARDGLRLQARMDVDLSDMLTLAVRTKLILNYPKKLSAVLPVELAVSVIRFSGTLSISFIPSNPSQSTPTRMIFNFLDDYRLDFEIRSLLGSRSKLHNVPKIAQLVEARLHRWFDERAVEPRFQEIALPSLWPRKKNTRGPEDASTERSESIGRSRGNDAGRDHREEIRGRGGDAEIRDRGAGGTVRHRRGTRSNDSDDFSMPGSLPDFQVAAMTNSDPNPFPAHDPTQSLAPALSPCDERLEELDIGFWTSVPIASDLAAKAISLYLETDHPLLGPFDPTLFMEDLVHCRTNYCSKLLVSTIMYWSCQMYSAVDSTVQSFIPQFCEEADERWSLEKTTDSLLNLAATQLLGLAYLGNGKDHYVLTYVSEVNAMGARMGLFGVEQSVAISKAKQVSPELQSATSYAAWGTFNWIVLMALFYQQPGLSYPDHPPIVPIPGHEWYHPSEPSPESHQQSHQQTYMGDTFPILCRFWRIMHEVTLKYYRDQPFPRESLSSHITLAFAEYKYRELLAWAETLPPSMVRAEQSPHHVLVFHIWLHVAILCVLRPFTVRARDSPKPLRLKTFPCKRSSPDAAYKASVNQLKRLVVVYREKYACSSYTMLWHTALIHVANAILGDTKDPAWRFYLFFCVESYGELRRSFRFAETIGRSILSMALQQGDLSADEARRLMVQFEENRLTSPSEDIRATFMADLNLAMTDPEEASVESLSDRFEDIALFREFTNAGDSSEDEPVESDDNTWDTL